MTVLQCHAAGAVCGRVYPTAIGSILGQASGGEILVSWLLKELTQAGGDIEFGEPREMEMRGLTGTQRVFPVNW